MFQYYSSSHASVFARLPALLDTIIAILLNRFMSGIEGSGCESDGERKKKKNHATKSNKTRCKLNGCGCQQICTFNEQRFPFDLPIALRARIVLLLGRPRIACTGVRWIILEGKFGRFRINLFTKTPSVKPSQESSFCSAVRCTDCPQKKGGFGFAVRRLEHCCAVAKFEFRCSALSHANGV